jgi:type IV pilus assembly protein PilV
LIESLIALLVLSIALLGVGALQLVTMHEEMQARWRSEAVNMAGTIFEQLRIDSEAAKDVAISDNSASGCIPKNAWLCQSLNDVLGSAGRVLPNLNTSLSVDASDGVDAASLEIAWARHPESDNALDCQSLMKGQTELSDDGAGCIWLESLL